MKTLITYLELDGILQSTGSFYSEFKFQPQRPSAEILAQFDADRAEFLRSVFACAKFGKTWFSLDADAAARQLKQPRERIVAALNYLEERGDLVVEATGRAATISPSAAAPAIEPASSSRSPNDFSSARRTTSPGSRASFRWRSTTAALPVSCWTISANRAKRAAIAAVARESRRSRWLGWSPGCRKRPTWPRFADLRAEKHQALATPRQLARFLCGISSPATTRGKLRQRKEFGQWSHRRFADVLALAERG